MKKIVVLSLALFGCGKSEVSDQPVDRPVVTPAQTVARYYEAVNKQDSLSAYATLTQDAEKRTRNHEWVQKTQWRISESYDFKLTDERISSDLPTQAFVTGVLATKKADSILSVDTMLYELHNEAGQWRIAKGQLAL